MLITDVFVYSWGFQSAKVFESRKGGRNKLKSTTLMRTAHISLPNFLTNLGVGDWQRDATTIESLSLGLLHIQYHGARLAPPYLDPAQPAVEGFIFRGLLALLAHPLLSQALQILKASPKLVSFSFALSNHGVALLARG